MKVLYRNDNQCLAIMSVSKAVYIEEIQALELCGTEEDIAVLVTKEQAEKIVNELYDLGKANITEYPYCEIEVEVEEDDDEDDEAEEFDDMLERILDNSDNNDVFRFR